jgi:hypothetical protein
VSERDRRVGTTGNLRLTSPKRRPIAFNRKKCLPRQSDGKHEIHRLETVFLTVDLVKRKKIDHYFAEALDAAVGIAFAFRSPSAYWMPAT